MPPPRYNPPRERNLSARFPASAPQRAVRLRTQAIVTHNLQAQSKNRWAKLDQALKATDLLLQSGGFGLIVIDLGDIPADQARRIPLTSWFRFRRVIENTPEISACEAMTVASVASITSGMSAQPGARP